MTATRSWAPGWPQVAVTAVAAAALVVAAFHTDAPGVVLCVAGAALLAGLAGRDALLRPALAAGPDGLVVATGVRKVAVAWSQVGPVRATEARRLLLSRSLEVELGEQLVVLPERRLGAPAREVAAALAQLRAGG